MCSIGDSYEDEAQKYLPSNGKIQLENLKCNKCRDKIPLILLRHKDAYCKECFLTGSTHKFKALLGKSKLIYPNDRILISYEIGHPSTALLNFIRTGLDLNTPKKLRFQPVFVFLEDQYHLTLKERTEMVEAVIQQGKEFKFEIFPFSFSSFISKIGSLQENDNFNITDKDKEDVNKIFADGINQSNKKEILNLLRRNALISIAQLLKCKFIFTPELSEDIASNILTNISLGKGSQVPNDTGFCDNRNKEIQILRPLRTFDMKELAFYNILNGLIPVAIRQIDSNPYSCIQKLMKKFILDLQENYPASVTTVVRTGDKLALDKNKIIGKCKLCEGVLLEETDELSSEKSTNFSKIASNEPLDHQNLCAEERFEKIKEKFIKSSNLNYQLCYSCAKISEYLL